MVYKVCLTLSILCASVYAELGYERANAFSYFGDDGHFRRPWDFGTHDSHQFASSEQLPSYRNQPRGAFGPSDRSGKPKEYLSVSSTKKIPQENKNFKKSFSPFYTITENDSPKYKDVVMKSGSPYCVELKEESSGTEKSPSKKGTTTCYKCKDPKNGSTYEQCSYVSKPSKKSASTKIERLVAAPDDFRYKRSAFDDGTSSDAKSSNYKGGKSDYRKRDSPYRFDDEVLADMTHDVPAEYKNKDEECERVVKDSMICMVCKDAKTNAKYEQCSYSRQPNEKAYSYSKSSSFKNPQKAGKKEGDSENPKSQEDREYSESKPIKEDREYSGSKPVKEDREYSESKPIKEDREFSYPTGKHRENAGAQDKRSEKENSEESSSNCKRVQKDSESCMVCKDPKTGGNYEKCSYSYQPNDKVYKFSRSKSFGYPQSSSSKESENPSKNEKSKDEAGSHADASSEYLSDYSIPESFYDKPEKSPSSSFYGGEKSSRYLGAPSTESKSVSRAGDSSDYPKSESEKASEEIDQSNCKEVQKDSMTCKVCKDPKTGTDLERCSYNYKPSDKLYSYMKSRSFGSPAETADRSDESKSSRPRSSEEPSSSERKEYSFPQKTRSYTTASDARREFPEFPISSESQSKTKTAAVEKATEAAPTKVDAGFYDSLKKKEEIEKFVKEFQKEDRSNCKKVMRDKMTCYQCVDEKGFQKEECAFITAGEPSKEKFAYREVKEFQTEPAKKVPRSAEKQQREEDVPLEPAASASENVDVKKSAENERSEGTAQTEGDPKEVDAYEYAAETKPVYDKVLGLTLPAYMLAISEHEAEFDEAVASSRF